MRGHDEIMETKNYSLKLGSKFFKRHDIITLERSSENGLLIGYFYIKLLVESIDHKGRLRFSDEKPYNNRTLSAVTDMPLEIVEEAMESLAHHGLIEIDENGTIHMANVKKMLKNDTGAERQQRYRDRHKKIQAEETVEEVVDGEPKTSKMKKKKATKKTMDTNLDHNNEQFKRFWSVYPRKVGKDKCYNWFKARKITDEFVDDLVLAIEMQKKSEQWTKGDGNYIPHPYTWLNRGGWNDELKYKEQPQEKIKNRWENFLNE